MTAPPVVVLSPHAPPPLSSSVSGSISSNSGGSSPGRPNRNSNSTSPEARASSPHPISPVAKNPNEHDDAGGAEAVGVPRGRWSEVTRIRDQVALGARPISGHVATVRVAPRPCRANAYGDVG